MKGGEYEGESMKGLQNVDHLLAAVFGVADEALPLGVNNPVHQFQRSQSDDDREFIALVEFICGR